MDNKNLNERKSLELIEKMIGEVQHAVADNGFHFRLWGILVVLASLTQYFMIRNGLGTNSNMVWMIMPAIGAPVAFVYEYRKDKKNKGQVVTATNRIYTGVWLGFGITLGITIYIMVLRDQSPIPAINAIVGLATFISGRILKFSPLTVGGFVFWVAAVVCAYIAGENQLLINAGAIVLGYLIPGFMLYYQSGKKNVQTA